MNKEEWLINEVDKWQDDSIVDVETGEKIKKQYELYRDFCPNIFSILFSVLGAVLIIAGAALASVYTWGKMPNVLKLIVAISPLIISYILSIYTILFKTENKVLREISAFTNVVAMFVAFGAIVNSFHFEMTLSNYLIISSILTIPVLYIMRAISPLVIYYLAILMWGSLNMAPLNALILLGLFLLGIGLIVFNIKTYNKTLKWNVTICALSGVPFMMLFMRMLNGDLILGSCLYCTILFALRDIKKHYFPLKSIAMVVSLFTIICMTTSQAWIIGEQRGGVILGILTGLILLTSLALEVFNTKEDTYEFSYLFVLMGLSIIRYIWGCLHSSDYITQIVFMCISIFVAVLVALGFVSLGKNKKRMGIATIGFFILGITVLIKLCETNLFFLGRALAFLGLGSIFLILVIILSLKNKDDENNEEGTTKEGDTAKGEEETVDGGKNNEEDNIVS